MLATHAHPAQESNLLQSHLFLLEPWVNQWRIPVKEIKSVLVTFALRRGDYPPPSSTRLRFISTRASSESPPGSVDGLATSYIP